MNTFNIISFIVLPYMAIVIFLIGTITRYRMEKFTVSSLSSQFLESKKLFWGSVPFHLGISFLFFGHLVAFLFPRSIILWNSQPLRLLILEITAFIFAIYALVGIVHLFKRRMTDERIDVLTTKMDVFVELLLLVEIFSGIYTAIFFRWGSSWFASVMTPYLKSIFLLSPDVEAVSAMPFIFKLHVIGAFLIILMIPFTRLMHILVLPINYLWKPYQQVIWYWNRRKIRKPETDWSKQRPKNN